MTLTAKQKAPLAKWRTYVSGLWRRREFAFFLIQGNLTARNASTTLGLMWWILHPLLAAAIFFIVFGLILGGRRSQPEFLSYLVVGVFAFQFTTASMNGGSNLVSRNAKLLVNVRFPRLILPIAATGEALVGFVTSLSAVLVITLVAGIVPNELMLMLIPTLVIHTVFCLGLASLTARWVVPFRDIGNLIPHITRFWFYLTPIIWGLDRLETIPSWAKTLVQLNPMYSIVQLYRVAFIHFPFEMRDLLLATLWAAIFGAVGIFSFVRNEGRMVRYL